MAPTSNGSARKGRPVGTSKTTRLRKLECAECGYVVRVSRRWIAVGLPTCPCGDRLIPDDPDDAALALSPAELEEHPGVVEYRRVLTSVTRGQSGPARSLKGMAKTYSPHELVLARIEKERAERGVRNRLAALRKGLADDIPF